MVCLDHCQLTILVTALSIDRTTPQAYKLKINLLHLESSEKDHKSTEKRRGGEAEGNCSGPSVVSHLHRWGESPGMPLCPRGMAASRVQSLTDGKSTGNQKSDKHLRCIVCILGRMTSIWLLLVYKFIRKKLNTHHTWPRGATT